jgi:uncharacterized protein (DUF302 family)
VATNDAHGVISLRGEGDVAQLLRRAVGHIEGLGLEVLAVIDHSGDAADVGVSMPDTKLVLIGSPKGLAALMTAHPRLAIELPLKLLIAERDDGDVVLSYHAPDRLAHRYQLTDAEAEALRLVDAIARKTRRTGE